MQTRDQKYAVDVYKRVSQVEEKNRNSYGSMAHKLPILIRTAGLVQALAFVESKAKNNTALKQLLNDLSETVDKPGILTEAARTAPLSEYMLLTQQTMAALLWYKRFAQSVLGIQAGDEEEGK
jgi:CRISPR-associated protein Cmr5